MEFFIMTIQELKDTLETTQQEKKNFYAIPLKKMRGLFKDELMIIKEVKESSFLAKSNSKNEVFEFHESLIGNFKYIH